jgi:POT family proton-dependent oligopeptide transporter
MGVWFVSLALGNLIAGLVGGRVDPEKLPDMPRLFQLTAYSQIAAAVLCGLLVIPIARMMRGERARGA